MNNKTILPQLSSEESNTSSSSLISSDKNNIESADRFVHLKETKTHLFCLIPSDNASNKNPSRATQLIRIKISKRRPQSKHLTKNKVFDCSNLPGGTSNSELMVSSNRTRTKNDLKTTSLNLLSNRKKTDHPSFVVLPENKKCADLNVKTSGNQSTSDNSNETYVIRSKEENKLLANRASQTSFRRAVPMFRSDLVFPISKSKFRIAAESSSGPKSTEIKSEDYCQCAKNDERKQIDSFHRTSKNDNIALPKESSPIQAISRNPEELFRIKFIEPTQLDASSRLKAGQDREDKNYKVPRYTSPKITRIFPPSGGVTRRDDSQSNLSGRTSTERSNRNNNEIVKINYNLVRRCLKHSSAEEKCEVLDALRARIKSKTLNVATKTIEEIQKFDLFGVQCECRSRPILEDLFWPMTERIPHPLQTSIARLINAMVSYETGLDYFNNRSIIHLFTWGDLGRDNIDEEMADNLMAVMMKLSKNRFHCNDMIKKGLLKWLLNHMALAEYSASKYQLKCMTGLLRMLMRVENSIDLSMTEIRDWIVMLGRYLDSENTNVRRNILASLLALFQRNGAIASANEMNFAQIINKHIEMSSNSLEKKHLKILNQLLTGKSNLTKTRKSAIQSAEEELYFDDERESGGSEIDYHPGEKLLREKFCINKDEQSSSRRKKKNFSFEIKEPTCNPPNDDNLDNLASRVFIEHLHCQLPKIDQNRIFPMFNYRTVDIPKSCVHIKETAPLKSPYVSGTTRKLKFHDRLSRQGKQMTNTNEQHRRENTAVKQSPKKFKDELTEQHMYQQLPAEVRSTLQDSTAVPMEVQLSSTVPKILNDEIPQNEKHFLEKSREKLNAKLIVDVAPVKYEEVSTEETDILEDKVSENDQQLSVETTDKLKNESTVEYLKQQSSAGEPKGKKDLVVGRRKSFEEEQELSTVEPDTLEDDVLETAQHLSVGAKETLKDELNLYTDKLETFKGKIAKNDFKVDIEKLPCGKSINDNITESSIGLIIDQLLKDVKKNAEPSDLQVGTLGNLKDETVMKNDQRAESMCKLEVKAVIRRDDSAADHTRSQQLEIYAVGLKEEVLPPNKIDEHFKDELIYSSETVEKSYAVGSNESKMKVGERSDEETQLTVKSGQHLSTGSVEALKSEADKWLSGSFPSDIKINTKEATNEKSNKELPVMSVDKLTDDEISRKKSDQLLPFSSITKLKNTKISSVQSGQLLSSLNSEVAIAKMRSGQKRSMIFAEKSNVEGVASVKSQPNSDEIKDGEIVAVISSVEKILEESDLNVDIEKLLFDKTSIDSTIDHRLDYEPIGGPNEKQFGASSKSKDEKIASVENYQQFSAKSVDKLARCAVTRRASDKCVASEVISKLKQESVTTVKSNQQLSSASVEILKGEANDGLGGSYSTLLVTNVPMLSAKNVLERQEAISQELSIRPIEELKDKAIGKQTSEHIVPSEDVLKVNEINKVASAPHLTANERTKEGFGGVKSVQQLIATYVEMSEDETINKRGDDRPSTETDIAKLTIDPKFGIEIIAERSSDKSSTLSTITKSMEIESDEQLPIMSVEMLTFKVIAKRATPQTMEKSKSDQQMRRKNVVKPTRSEPPIIHTTIDENLKEESIARQTSDEQVRIEQQNSKGEAITRHASGLSSPGKEFFRQTIIEQSEGDVKGSTERIVASLEIDQNLEIEAIAIRTSDNPLSSATIVKDVKRDQQLRVSTVEILRDQISDPTKMLSIAGTKSDEQNDVRPTSSQESVIDDTSPFTTIGTSKEIECVKSDEQLPFTSIEILKDEATDEGASCNRSTSLTMNKSKEIATNKSDQRVPVNKTKNEAVSANSVPSVVNKKSKEETVMTDQKTLSRLGEKLEREANVKLTSDHVVKVNSMTNIEEVASQRSVTQLSSLSSYLEDQAISTTDSNRKSSTVSAENSEDQAVTKVKTDSIVRTSDQAVEVSLIVKSKEIKYASEKIATEPDKLEEGVIGSDQHVSLGVNETSKDELKLCTDEPETFKSEISKSDQQISPGATDTLTNKILSAPEKYEEFSVGKPKMLKDEVGADLKSDQDSSAETVVGLEYELMEYEKVSELVECEAVPIAVAFSDKSLKKEMVTSSKSDQKSFVKSSESCEGISVTTAISATQSLTAPIDILNDEVIVRRTIDEGFVAINQSREECNSIKSDQQLSSLGVLDGAAIVGRTNEHRAQVKAIRKSKEEIELSEESDQQIYDKDVEHTSTHDNVFSLPSKETINKTVSDQEIDATRLSKGLEAGHLQSDEKLTVQSVEPVDGATHTPEAEVIKSDDQLNDTIPRIKRQQLEVYARELNEEVIARLEIDQKLKKGTIATRESHEQVNAPTEVSQSQHLFDNKEIKGQSGRTLKYIQRLAPRSAEVGQFNEIKKGASYHHLPANAKGNQEAISSVKSAQQLKPRSLELINEETTDKSPSEDPSSTLKSHRRLAPRSVEVRQFNKITKGLSDHHLAANTRANEEAVSSVESAHQLHPKSVEIINEETIHKSANDNPSGTLKSNQRLARRSVEVGKVNKIKKWASDQHFAVDENAVSGVKSAHQLRGTSVEISIEEKNNKSPSDHLSTEMDVVSTQHSETDVMQLEMFTTDVKGREEIVASKIDQELTDEATRQTSNQQSGATSLSKAEYVTSMERDADLLPRDAVILKNKTITRGSCEHSPLTLSNSQEWKTSAVKNDQKLSSRSANGALVSPGGQVVEISSIAKLKDMKNVNIKIGQQLSSSSRYSKEVIAKTSSDQSISITSAQKMEGKAIDKPTSELVDEVLSDDVLKVNEICRQSSSLPLHLEEQAISPTEANRQSANISDEKSKHEAVTIVKSDQYYNDFKNYAITEVISSVEEMIEEHILSVEMPTTESTGNRSFSDITAVGSEHVSTEISRIKTVDSCIWREMLHNDELIDRLCEKVLKKLRAGKFCGSNCGSPCGGLNPNYDANKLESKEKSQNPE